MKISDHGFLKFLIFILSGLIAAFFLIAQEASITDIVVVALNYSLLSFALVYLWGRTKSHKAFAILIIILIAINLTMSFTSHYYYDSTFSITSAKSILNSNDTEASEFILEHSLLFLFLAAFLILSLFLINTVSKRVKKTSYRKYFHIFIAFNALLYAASYHTATANLGEVYTNNKEIKFFKKTVFYNAPAFIMTLNEKEYLSKVIRHSKYSFYPDGFTQSNQDDKQKVTVVIVIGESARRDRHGLFGYQYNTTPYLSEIENSLNKYTNVNSPASQTVLSLPTSFTTASIKQFDLFSLNKNIITLLNQSGFQTTWITQQGFEYGANESHMSVIAQNAKNKISPEGEFDESVLPYLDQYINNEENNVIFVHLSGSHPMFKNRYPADFENPHLMDHEAKNTPYYFYDQSISYTDYVLREVIRKLENKNSVLLYFSDHGLQDHGKTFRHGSSHPTQETYEIPFFVWQSKNFNQNRNLNTNNTDKNFNTEHLFYTIADLLEIRNYQGEEVCKSIFQDCYIEPTENIVVDETLTYHTLNNLKREVN